METKREISLNLPFCLLCKDRRRLEPVRAADAQNPHRIESLVLAKSFEEKITKIGGADYMFIGDGQNIHACHCLLITWLSQKGFQIAKSYLMILRSCRSKLKNLKLCHFLHVYFYCLSRVTDCSCFGFLLCFLQELEWWKIDHHIMF